MTNLSTLELTLIDYASRWLKNTRERAARYEQDEFCDTTLRMAEGFGMTPKQAAYFSVSMASGQAEAMVDLVYEEYNGLSPEAIKKLEAISSELYGLTKSIDADFIKNNKPTT